MGIRYGIVGAAGYVAKKHFDAIYTNGHEVTHACDIHDNVGFMDSYSKDIKFTKYFHEFIREDFDVISICTPNFLHKSMCISAMEHGKDVILEKPACLSIHELDEMIDVQDKTDRQVSVVMQLRYAEEIINTQVSKGGLVTAIYHTPRGEWYNESWKSNDHLSGGVCLNIGIHLFDVLYQLLGTISYASTVTKSHSSFGMLYFKDNMCVYHLSILHRNKGSVRNIILPEGDILWLNEYFDGGKNSHVVVYDERNEEYSVSLEEARESLRIALMAKNAQGINNHINEEDFDAHMLCRNQIYQA